MCEDEIGENLSLNFIVNLKLLYNELFKKSITLVSYSSGRDVLEFVLFRQHCLFYEMIPR